MMPVAVLLVGHGWRVAEANRALYEMAGMVARQGGIDIVEVAFYGSSRPDVQAGIDACVARGARRILLSPYFLFAGTHVLEDFPAELAVAAKRHPGVEMVLGSPLGVHPKLAEIVCERADATLREAGWRP